MEEVSLLWQFWDNFRLNLFKPLLLFFYMGFSVPLLRVPFEFPHVIYQGLTIYLLIAIGWRGGEELADLPAHDLTQAAGLMVIGFMLNLIIGCMAYLVLRVTTRLRRVDAATVSGYYGSDSAGTFVTCVGVLTSLQSMYGSMYKPAPFMPVMLAVMEVPGCLVALYLVSRLRHGGMDLSGNMPDEPGYDPTVPAAEIAGGHGDQGNNGQSSASGRAKTGGESVLNFGLLHEVFLNPGLFLLFGGIFIGYISGWQRKGEPVAVIDQLDLLFVDLFQGALCLFLLEMGMTACKRLRDLRDGGLAFVTFGLIAPNVFATLGMSVLHVYSILLGEPFTLGTYPLFAVLCAAASYIAVPAVQRMAIPEASPTLPLAASLGLTFSYNVTIGIPVYIMIAQLIIKNFPVTGG